MCWCVYIVTSIPLSGVLFSKDCSYTIEEPPPPLHFQEVTEDEAECYGSLFKGKYLYSVGTNTGCGCGLERPYSILSYDNKKVIEYYDDTSPLAFIDFLKTHTRHEPLEMYVIWEDDRWTKPITKTRINAQNMTINTYFKLKSRQFYTFYALKLGSIPNM